MRRWLANNLLDALGFVVTLAVCVGLGVILGAATTAPQYMTVEKAVHHWHGLELENHVLFPDATEAIEFWKVEVSRRFPDAFVFVCHGNEEYDGKWVARPQDGMAPIPVQELADQLRQRFPDRVIVLLICNPGADVINTPGVYYALANVWYFPDRTGLGLPDRAIDDPTSVGNIYEFVGIPLDAR